MLSTSITRVKKSNHSTNLRMRRFINLNVSASKWKDDSPLLFSSLKVSKTSKRVDYPCFLQTKLFDLWFKDLEHIEVLDCSEYEKAGIIIDLNLPIDNILHEKYDFIYDGSVLDSTELSVNDGAWNLVSSANLPSARVGLRGVSLNNQLFMTGINYDFA